MEKFGEEKVTPEKALELLRKGGLDVSLEQAQMMLELLRTLATIVVAQYLKSPE